MDEAFSALGEDAEICRPLMQGLACLPVFLNLAGRRVVLAGGSSAILWKAELCQAAGAEVEVFGANPCSGLAALARRCPAVALVRRGIAAQDFYGAALAIAEAESAAEALSLQEAAARAGVPINVVDKPIHSDFQFGAIVDRSPVVVGISTNGVAPVLAQGLRGRIEGLLAAESALWAKKARSWRESLKSLKVTLTVRRRFWELFSNEALAGRRAPQEHDFHFLLGKAESTAPAGGCVVIVGAGPGDPELITLKALRALQSADAVLYDDLVSPAIVEMARREAEKIPVGKRGYKPSYRQDHIISLLISLASQGKKVIRLKGGDPMVFGRANEEIAALKAAAVPVEIIPGVTAALGAAAGLQVSLTQREIAQRLQFVTAHAHDGKLPEDVDWRALCDPRASTIVYMGLRTLDPLRQRLLANGIKPSTPAILVERATCPDERHIFGTIDDIAGKVAAAGPEGPCVILIGEAFANAFSLPQPQVTIGAKPGTLAL